MRRLRSLLAVLVAAWLFAAATAASAAGDLIPRPAALEPDVQFWIKVYSQITTNEGYLHDQHNLSVIYETHALRCRYAGARAQGARRGTA